MNVTARRDALSFNAQIVGCALVVFGCGGGTGNPVSDAKVQDDAAAITLDCTTYCREIQANCTGGNAQYPDMACSTACASFTVGQSMVTDMSGNTLGCRISYAVKAKTMSDPASYCVIAGPAGDSIASVSAATCSGGDVCASFCKLEIQACGSTSAPLPGNPRDAMNGPLYRYENMSNCLDVCANRLDKTHAYSTVAVGDSLACRLLQAIRAAVSSAPGASIDAAKMYCPDTAAEPTGLCAGVASP